VTEKEIESEKEIEVEIGTLTDTTLHQEDPTLNTKGSKVQTIRKRRRLHRQERALDLTAGNIENGIPDKIMVADR